MPDGVLWIRANAFCAFVCLSIAFAWVFLASFGFASIPIAIGVLLATLLLMSALHGVPALGPRRGWAYWWTAVHIVMLLLSCWWSLPALIAIVGFALPTTRPWYSEAAPQDVAIRPLRRYGPVAIIVIYWVVATFGMARAAVTAFDARNEVLADGEAVVMTYDGKIDHVPMGGPRSLTGFTPEGQPWDVSGEDGPVTLVFWATWCPTCEAAFADHGRELSTLPGTTIAVATDCGADFENIETVRAKLAAASLSAPIVCAPAGELEELVEHVPTTMVLDAERRLRFSQRGFIDAADLALVLTALPSSR